MEIFTMFGINIVFLAVSIVLAAVFASVMMPNEVDILKGLSIGFIIVLLIISIIFSIFMVMPESFGYTKIDKSVSENDISGGEE